ncbi:MAG: ribosome maturation factor RimP [Desulfobacterales bacterium]|nr:ribosome maturation factor RimP [Desulfobacterales bacterium]
MIADRDDGPVEKADTLGHDRQVAARVTRLAEPVCRDEGLELVYVQYRREAHGRVLRLFIDKAGGVSLDDCTRISRQLSDILDVNLEDIGPYHLEVSSPGADRPLGKPEDFERFQGHQATIRTLQPINGRKNFKGTLKGISADGVCLVGDNDETVIPWEKISIARLVNFNGEIKCS